MPKLPDHASRTYVTMSLDTMYELDVKKNNLSFERKLT